MAAILTFKKVLAGQLPSECYLDEAARRLTGTVEYRADHEGDLRRLFRLRTHFAATHNPAGASPEAADIHVVLESQARVTLAVCDPNPSFRIGADCVGAWDIVFFQQASVAIGARTSSNGVKIMAASGGLVVGEDCMFSDSITVHCGDNHAVVDVETGEVLNAEPALINIGDHVWVGAGARVLKGADVGAGSIIGAGALVSGKKYPGCSVLAGNPARVVKTGISWTRNPAGKNWGQIKEQFAF